MKSTQRLKPILGIAIRQQEEKEAELARVLQVKRQAEQQLSALKNYRSEYHEALADGQSINISELINRQNFISQLDVAIAAQHEKTNNISTVTEHHEQDWKQARNRRDALENLIDKKLRVQRQKNDRAEQIEMDNLVCRAHASF